MAATRMAVIGTGPTTASDRLASLDVLRLLSCAVIWFAHLHFIVPAAWRGVSLSATPEARLAVKVFFVISGFVITRLLRRQKAQGIPLRYFLARRSLRIFPSYYLLLVGITLLSLGQVIRSLPVPSDWTHWAYLYNWRYAFDPPNMPLVWGHTWSLCVEEQFYLLWPLLVYWLSDRASWRAIAWIVLPLSLAWTALHPHHNMRLFATPPNFLPLSLGAMMAYHEQWVRSAKAVRLTVAALLVGVLLYRPSLWPVPAPLQLVGISVLSGGIVLAALSMAEPLAQRQQWLARAPWLTEWGMMSYGLYLYHGVAYNFAYIVPGLWVIPLGIGLTVVIALLSFRFVEKPAITYGARRFGAAAYLRRNG